jgi:hypothetical protein
MIDFVVTWALGNPLTAVGVLVVFAIAVGLFLVPRLHDVADHGHPRV